MTVGELLSRISSEELTDWMAYEQMHGPLGPSRGDWHAALLAQVVTSTAWRGKGRRPQVRDFLLTWKGGGDSDPEAMEQLGRKLASRVGGTWTEGRAGGGES